MRLFFVLTIFIWWSMNKADAKCGQLTVTLNQLDEKVSLEQPSFPDDSSSYLDCEYKISAPKNSRIRFRILDFGVQAYGSSFYIWFFNGFSTASSDRFLILSKPDQTGLMQHSGSNAMTVNLRVPKSYTYTGFRITYMAIASCGSRLEAWEEPQKLTSPGFPFRHLPNQICLWTIIATSDHVIEISVDEITKRSCCDKLQIVGSKTNLSIGKSYTSSGKTMQIEFIANSSIGSSSFVLSYRSEHICKNKRLIAHVDAKQTFRGPAFPSQYLSIYLFCWYTITSPQATRIQFSIDSFEARYHYHYTVSLWFYNGLSNKDERFLVIDKRVYVSVTRFSKSNIMGIQLKAHRNFSYRGFQITYKAIAAACGERLSAGGSKGIILSPGYPQRHLADQVCTWYISAPTDQHIKLSLQNADKEPCCVTFQVVDSKKNAAEMLEKNEYFSLGDKVELTFISTRSIVRKEFRISYESYFCGYKASAVKRLQNLTSPGYPMQHAADLSCSWDIIAPQYHLIEVKARFVSNETCCTSVKVGTVELFTGSVYTSAGPSMRIDLFSHNSVIRKGFELQFRAVDACGQRELEAEVGVEKQLRPPFHRGAWGNHVSCKFTISSPENTKIQFSIDDFDTRYHYYHSHLWFSDESDGVSKRFLSGNYAKELKKAYFSPSNRLGIGLTQYVDGYTGLKMRYTAIQSCQTNSKVRVATAATQFISGLVASSPFRICTWTIHSATYHIIEVVVVDIGNKTCCTQIQVKAPYYGNTQLYPKQVYTSPGTTIDISVISTNATTSSDLVLQFREVHICGWKEYEAKLYTEKQIQLAALPQTYRRYFYCWYIINSMVQTRIRFWIVDFETIRSHFSYFYLHFYNGVNELNTEKFLTLDKLSQAGMMQHSRSNHLGIRLIAYKLYGYAGLTMRYVAIHACEETVLRALSVPQNLSYYGNSLELYSEQICTWNIRSEKNHVIQTKVNYISNTTYSDIVQFEAQGSSAKLYTGQDFTSPGPSVAITLISTNTSEPVDFTLQYRAVHVCGDLHYEAEVNSEKTIHPPPFPSDYGIYYLHCWYAITSPKNTKIQFWVESLGSIPLRSYHYYLWFYYGRKQSSQKFLTITSRNQAGIVRYSKSNELGIKLQTYKSSSYTGFILKYTALRSCDNDPELLVRDTNQNLIYPRDSLQAFQYEICSWTIKSSNDYVIELTPYYGSKACCSVLQVQLLRPIKTEELQSGKTYLSNESTVVIMYVSNYTLQQAELQISYRKVHVCGASELRAELNFQKEFRATPFPKDGRRYLYCWYTIISPRNTRIGFWILSSGARYNFNVHHYYLKFFDSWQTKGTPFLTMINHNYIGTLYYSKSDVMNIALKTCSWCRYTGFSMKYFAVSSCGNRNLRVTETPQVLTFKESTLGNQSYGICGWHITASHNYAIELNVLSIDRVDNGNLPVLDYSLTGVILRRGQQYRSSKQHIEIRQEIGKIKAFQIQYKAVHVCGVMNFKADLGTENRISQLGFFENYRYLSCWYVVKSPETTNIRFSLSSFKRITHLGYFSLKFYDGLDEESNLFLTLGTGVHRSKVYRSKDNIMGIKLYVNSNFYGYTGFSIDFSAVEVGDGSLVRIRVAFDKTYQLLASKELMQTYFLSKYETLDLSGKIFQNIINEDLVKVQLVHGEEAPDFNGKINVTVRVDQRWTFISNMKSEFLGKFHFNAIGINDVSFAVFSRVRESSDVIQLVKITEVDTFNGTFVFVRIHFFSTYKVYLSSSIQTQYGLIYPDINDVASDLFDDIGGAAYSIQLYSTKAATPPSGISIKIRLDFSLVYRTTMSDVVMTRYQFDVNITNDVSTSVFPSIRKEANSVKLIYLETEIPSTDAFPFVTIRVELSRSYKLFVQLSSIEQFNFNDDSTNDVTEEIFDECVETAKYVQLVGYTPEVFRGQLVTVKVDFTWNYHVYMPKETLPEYFLSSIAINDVSKEIFFAIRSKAWVVQLSAVDEPETPIGICTKVRVDFKGIYRIYASQAVREKYFPSILDVNDVTLGILWKLQNKTDAMQLIRLNKTIPIGTSVKVRVKQNRVYHVYLSDDAIQDYNFHSTLTNDISSSIFQRLVGVASFLQIFHIGVVTTTGVKVTVRVEYSQVYDVYVTQELRRKYNFILGRTNEISQAAFLELRQTVTVAKLIRLKTEVTDDTPTGSLVRIRVEFNLVYNVYIADDIRVQYLLQLNTTNDVSTEIFARVQGKASSFKLLGVTDEFVADHQYAVRVDFHHVYHVAMNDETFSRYPLSLQTINDVTSMLFAKIRLDSTGVQLVKLDNPATITIRVDFNWVYRVVVTGQMKEQYNFSLNVTNDVTTSVFTSLKKTASSVQILYSRIFDVTVGIAVTVQVDDVRVYKVVCLRSVIAEYNLSPNETNVISVKTFQLIRKVANALQLAKVESPDYCPSNNWTMWFNDDDPSGACDCETLPELRRKHPGKICDKPTSVEARLENCMTSYDVTLPNIEVNVDIGFKCENKDGIACLDYEVRFCCP